METAWFKYVGFEGSVFQHERAANSFRCPKETRIILRGLAETNPGKRAAFDKCALLYQLALTIGRYHPTVRISYEYASVNAIVQALSKEYRGVRDFIRKNVSGSDDCLLDFLHSKIRSAHWHGGEFALGETDHGRDHLTHPEGYTRFYTIMQAHRHIRTAIFTWVMKEIAIKTT